MNEAEELIDPKLKWRNLRSAYNNSLKFTTNEWNYDIDY